MSDELAIVTLPGEVFVELGLAIKKASPFETTLVIELANDGPGYVPTSKAFAEGSYETVNSRVASGGGEQMAAELGVPFVGRIPIYQPIREGSDAGVPLMISEPESPAARAFMAAAERTAAQVSIASYTRPTIPLTVVR